MMLTIHGLPLSAKYHDLKTLIREKCNITDYILDNLVSEGDGTKKVRIGLTDEREGINLIKYLDGFRMAGNVLRVLPVGKPAPTNQQNFDQRGGYPQRNEYPNQTVPSYGQQGRPVEATGPWGSGNNQWGPNQGQNQMSQGPVPQNNYNYQQPQGMTAPYGQQQGPPGPRPDIRPQYDQRDQYQVPGQVPLQNEGYGFPKSDMPDHARNQRRVENPANVLRSVKIVDEPLGRPITQPQRYLTPAAPHNHVQQQKPITIMKENFQGPQYNLDRQPAQLPFPGGAPMHSGPLHGPGALQGQGGPYPATHPAPGQQTHWTQPIQQDKAPFEKPSPRPYPDPNKRPMMGKPAEPRFSPRRDVPDTHGGRRIPSPGRRTSPGRRMPSPGRRMPSPGRRMPSPGRRMPSPGRRMASPGRRMASPGRRMPSPGRRMPSPGRRMPSPGRRMPSPGRRMPSPGRRMPSPGRRMPSPERRSSPGRRIPSPGRRMPSPGRRMPSPGRRMSSPGRRMPSPGRRMPSPGKRNSPGRRRDSPPLKRHDSPGRYSRRDGRADKPDGALKDVRPAYDPPPQAPNQAMYSGGYRPSLHENVQYPIPGARLPEPRAGPWQEREKASFAVGMKKDDDRRISKFEPRIDIADANRSRSPRKSRSPIRRDRSPLRDRYKKHSPSPRSPRRSWALEKRRSPEVGEAPPPPVWPGQSRNEEQFRRFSEEDKKRVPVWEPRRPEDERMFDNPVRVRTDLLGRPNREPSPRGGFKSDDRFPPREPKFEARDPKFEPRDPKFEPRDLKFEPREPKFEPREPKFEPRDLKFEPRGPKFEPRDPNFEPRGPKFEPRGPKFEPRDEFRDVDDMKRFGRDFRDPLRSNDDRLVSRHDRREEFIREDLPRREEERKISKMPDINKEFEDVYKRAQELNKRAEELRRRDERRRDEFERERSPKDFDRKFDRRDDRADLRNDTRREPEWKTEADRRNFFSPSLKAKREKAVEEISNKIVDKNGVLLSPEIRTRVLEELKLTVNKAIHDMFGYDEVSFIEMVVKFNAKYDAKAETRMFKDVLGSLPTHFRTVKRPANEPMRAEELPAKSARIPREADKSRDINSKAANETYIPDWQPNRPSSSMVSNLPPPTLHIPNPMLMPHFDMVQHMGMMVPQPVMVPAPTYGDPDASAQANSIVHTDFQDADNGNQTASQDGGSRNLYLCKDDFEPYSDNQAEYLKRFLVAQLVKASQSGQGWSPDFTLKGLQSVFRYEVETRDAETSHWLLNLDFSEFQLFNVLVYTKEELWYERAAVWLPGHSKVRNIEPLTKLKLQNRKLSGVNIGKWKFVKKIVTVKGTRIYVDMPPSSARALEKHKMLLSYELQKVSVFLKAVAVDKEVFDSGLRAPSITDTAEVSAAAQNSPMPSLGQDNKIVKICLKGNKTVSVEQARKIKDMVIYHIFKYHQEYPNGSKTDFEKFGFCLPGYFGVLPENQETKQWLMSVNIGKLNRHAVVVLGADEPGTKYIKMSVIIRNETSANKSLIFERLKQSNQGVKGLNFNMWKPLGIHISENRDNRNVRAYFEVEMDLESVETIITKLKYRLDYVDQKNHQNTVVVKYHESDRRLEELVKKYKAEMSDSYDVANMDIASSDEDDEIVYMGKVN